ncbi:PREDICTED: solute carrier family 25 member 38 isoform X2 [Dinoponera quadriceps]|uniref:Mitochondrial glycine transporter n=1 Tax=Dinoponera quadriceps TaxID=609295 RepID=A0A6P3XFJ7_DINQU|nr:PREDICTED: solute carrier family 25 member 38 isoform X2 [Dinoponera quadriceps]
MDVLSTYPILKSFLAGSFSGTFSTILFQPLDLVKTRLQSRVNAHYATPKSGMLGTVAHIVRKDNVFGLWRGMTPSITRVIPGVGLYFSSLHWLKHTFGLEELTALQAISLGITARSMSGALLIPITVVKTRFESDVYKYNSISEALKLIYKQEGMKGLSSGLVPTLLRDAPYSGLYLMFYTQLKKMAVSTEKTVDKSSIPVHFSCGILAGIMASIVTQPADVIKTKMQLYPNEFNGIYHATLFIYKKYGILGYFKGIVPRMLRRTLMTAMAWTVYEQVTRLIGLK